MNTLPYQPTPEIPKEPYQKFQVPVEEVAVALGPDRLQVSMLQGELEERDVVVVPGDQPENPALSLPRYVDEPVLAEFELGGVPATEDQPELPSMLMRAVKLHPDADPKLTELAGERFNNDPEGFLLAVFGGERFALRGCAFITRNTGYGIVGRESNLEWLDAFGRPKEEGWTPFKGNNSISRDQMTVAYLDGAISFKIDSANSRTAIRTRATDQHRAISAHATETQPQTVEPSPKAARGLLRLVRRPKAG